MAERTKGFVDAVALRQVATVAGLTVSRGCAGEELTVVLNTFKRLDLLQRSVQHYSQCPVVKRIHVNWAESTVTPDLSQETCCDTHVTFAVPLLTHNDSSLNTRFLPIPGVCVLLVHVGYYVVD